MGIFIQALLWGQTVNAQGLFLLNSLYIFSMNAKSRTLKTFSIFAFQIFNLNIECICKCYVSFYPSFSLKYTSNSLSHILFHNDFHCLSLMKSFSRKAFGVKINTSCAVLKKHRCNLLHCLLGCCIYGGEQLAFWRQFFRSQVSVFLKDPHRGGWPRGVIFSIQCYWSRLRDASNVRPIGEPDSVSS